MADHRVIVAGAGPAGLAAAALLAKEGVATQSLHLHLLRSQNRRFDANRIQLRATRIGPKIEVQTAPLKNQDH